MLKLITEIDFKENSSRIIRGNAALCNDVYIVLDRTFLNNINKLPITKLSYNPFILLHKVRYAPPYESIFKGTERSILYA